MKKKFVNNNTLGYLLLVILFSINVISKDFKIEDILSSKIEYLNRGYGCFSGKIKENYDEKFELVKFEGKVCRNIVDNNTLGILIGSGREKGDFIYDKNDIKILSKFDLINKKNNTEIEEKIKFIQLLRLIKSEHKNIRYRSNSTIDRYMIPETNYHLLYSEYINFQYGNYNTKEVIDLIDFFSKRYYPNDSKMLKNLELIKVLEKNYDVSKTEFNNEEIEIIYKMDYNTIEKILHKNIIELYLMLEKGTDAKLEF